jgi:hypothetical protein
MIEIDAFGVRHLPLRSPLLFFPMAKTAAAIAAMRRRFFVGIVRDRHLDLRDGNWRGSGAETLDESGNARSAVSIATVPATTQPLGPGVVRHPRMAATPCRITL